VEVLAADGAVRRLEGYAFVFERKTTIFGKKSDKRTTILDLGESGYIVNLDDSAVKPDQVSYDCLRELGLVATNGNAFVVKYQRVRIKELIVGRQDGVTTRNVSRRRLC
jgi:hypothetical protein